MRDSSGQSPPDMVKLGAFRSAVREPTVSKPYLKEHQEYNLQAMHGEVFFLMDWKRRILIASFYNCIQVSFKKSISEGKAGGFAVHNCLGLLNYV